MKVFLIGGLGFIGKRFIRQFSNVHEITVFAAQQDIKNAPKTLDLTKISIVEGSVVDNNLSEIVEKYQWFQVNLFRRYCFIFSEFHNFF